MEEQRMTVPGTLIASSYKHHPFLWRIQPLSFVAFVDNKASLVSFSERESVRKDCRSVVTAAFNVQCFA
jgi:hypothetical protein